MLDIHPSVANGIVVATALVVASVFFCSKALKTSSAWRATITPLASIMGSGFLVCAPLLYQTVGNWAVFAMAGLLVLAYLIGGVVRFNIKYGEPLFNEEGHYGDDQGDDHKLHEGHQYVASLEKERTVLQGLEQTSHFVLMGAYCVSISYYLQLLASFAFHSLSWQSDVVNKGTVTAILLGVALMGMFRGLQGVEKLERLAVSLNLTLISALIVGLAYFNIRAFVSGVWALPELSPEEDSLHLVRVLMGLLIVVQGFETSRFIGSDHTPTERIRTMRWAQLSASVIYVVFLALMAYAIGQAQGGLSADVTAIVSLSAVVASILPVMISVTAIGSQFAAATADNAGCAGLVQSLVGKVFSTRFAGVRIEYAFVAAAAIMLTWVTNVYEVISIASRAFAMYYALQSAVALIIAYQMDSPYKHKMMRIVGFGALMLVCSLVAVFGLPAE